LKSRAPLLLLLAASSLLGAVTLLGCQTVDLGAPPADVNLCEPSQKFFVESIWPMFLGNTYNGKNCYDSGCHGAGSTTAMTLTAPLDLAPDPTKPLPADWVANYAQATHRMNCSDPLDSDLLIYPENRVPHGGGMLIMPTGPEATLVSNWITAP
jgi:hypothetical protein